MYLNGTIYRVQMLINRRKHMESIVSAHLYSFLYCSFIIFSYIFYLLCIFFFNFQLKK